MKLVSREGAVKTVRLTGVHTLTVEDSGLARLRSDEIMEAVKYMFLVKPKCVFLVFGAAPHIVCTFKRGNEHYQMPVELTEEELEMLCARS